MWGRMWDSVAKELFLYLIGIGAAGTLVVAGLVVAAIYLL